MARVAVDVVIKPEILDPQGKAILSALARTGQPGVSSVRQGKHFDLEVDDSVSDADLEEIAGTLLANPVIETWTVTRLGSGDSAARPHSRRRRGKPGDAGSPDATVPATAARIGVITFPGTLDDVDAARAVRYAGAESVALWHADEDLAGVDAVVVPGGFSYGDYLRAGAIAAQAPIMRAVIDAARRGLPVLGICNGFQILCEAGLLPGALVRNAGLRFICRDQWLRVENTDSVWTSRFEPGAEILVPMKNAEGRFVAAGYGAGRTRGRRPGAVPLRR